LIGYAYNGSTVENCYAKGDVDASGNYSGGFVGYIASLASPQVTNCYATGDVEGPNYVGGFVGTNAETISKCYATGTATGSTNIGGFAGRNNGTISNCFWNTTTSGTTTGIGGGTTTGTTGITTTQMQDQSTFDATPDPGWDFTATTGDWTMDGTNNDGFPYLQWQTFPPLEITWVGGTDSDWTDATNWDGGSVPAATDNVIIPDVSAASGNFPVISSGSGGASNDLTVDASATLTVNSGGSLITNGTITNNGTIEVKQTIANDDKWHFISMPNNVTKVETFDGMYIQKWLESAIPTPDWEDITDPAEDLTPVQGYSLWSEADDKSSFTYTGTPNTGDQSIGITKTGSAASSGMNFVGNPYPSALDWDELSAYGSKYTWNGTGYDTYVYIPDLGYGTGSRYVSPMEGFFIYTAEATGTFNLDNSKRTHLPPPKKDGGNKLNKGLVLAAYNGNYEDKLWIVFNEQAHENFELQRDAWKLLSGTAGLSQLWSICSNGNLAIDKRPFTETIQLGYTNKQSGIYSIAIKKIADIPEAFLEDTKTNIFHNLRNGEYEFVWNPETDLETRFKLHFKAVGINENQISESNILIYAANQQIIIKNVTGVVETDGRLSLSVTDILGRIVLQQNISASEMTAIPVNLETGVYVVMVRSGSGGSGACSTVPPVPLHKTKKVFIK